MDADVARPIPLALPARPQREAVLSNGALGMLLFVATEIMLFSGFVSAFTIARSGAMVWPPPNQPRLPIEETALNSAALLASGALLFAAARLFRRGERARARRPMLFAMLLGACFVVFQGVEWLALIREGLTLTSSILGSFFYVIIGMHALHAVVALGALVYAWLRLQRGYLAPGQLAAAEIFWYFVVGVWPMIYWRVYLT